LLGSYLPRNSFPSGGSHPATASQLVANGDRIGWFSKVAQLYVEFSLDGKEIGRYKTSVSEPHGVALCEDQSVWISSILRPDKKAPPLTELLALDRDAGTWAIHRRPTYSYIYGCDSALVTTPSPQLKKVERLSLR
jgi:hypothetical protein